MKVNWKGSYSDQAAINGISNPEISDYAWNEQTLTVWCYDGNAWLDTNEAKIPIVKASSNTSFVFIQDLSKTDWLVDFNSDTDEIFLSFFRIINADVNIDLVHLF